MNSAFENDQRVYLTIGGIIITALVAVCLALINRRWKKEDDYSNAWTSELQAYMDQLRTFQIDVLTHQSGDSRTHANLLASRQELAERKKHLAEKRMAVELLLPDSLKQSWELRFLRWQAAYNGESGLITAKAYLWRQAQIEACEKEYREYFGWLTDFKGKVIRGEVKLPKKR